MGPAGAGGNDLQNRIVQNRGALCFSQDSFADHQLDQPNHGNPFRATVVRIGFRAMGSRLWRFQGVFVRDGMTSSEFGDPLVESDSLLRLLLVERDSHSQAGL